MKKLMLGCFVMLGVICYIFQKISFLEVSENSKNSFLAISINGTESTTFPTTQNYNVTVSCKNAFGYWDNNTWSLRVKNLKKTREKCDVSFVETYMITYELNGGEFANNVSVFYEYEMNQEQILVDRTNLFKLNYSFAGWYDNPSFSGDAITKIASTDRGNKTLYAKWVQNYSSIEFLSKTTYTGGTKYENNQFVFDFYQENNILGFSKFQLFNSPNGGHVKDFLATESYEKGLFVREFLFDLPSSDYIAHFGINGSLYDPKPYFTQYFEQGKTYRVSFRVTYATLQKVIWNMLNLEDMQ